MNAIITTTLSYFNMHNIKPNFSVLAREYNIDRHTLKKHYDAGGYKPRHKNTPHVKFETPKGKQLQVDWKEDISIITKLGEVIKFNLFAATLGYSRLHYFVYSESRTEEAFIRCLLDTIYHICGVLEVKRNNDKNR